MENYGNHKPIACSYSGELLQASEFSAKKTDIDSKTKLLYCRRPQKVNNRPLNRQDLTYVHHKELDKHGLPYYIIPVVYLPKKIETDNAPPSPSHKFRTKYGTKNYVHANELEQLRDDPKEEVGKRIVKRDDIYEPVAKPQSQSVRRRSAGGERDFPGDVVRSGSADYIFPQPSVRYHCEKATQKAKALTDQIKRLKEKSKEFSLLPQSTTTTVPDVQLERFSEKQEQLLKLQEYLTYTRPKSTQANLEELRTRKTMDCDTQTECKTRVQGTNTGTSSPPPSRLPKSTKTQKKLEVAVASPSIGSSSTPLTSTPTFFHPERQIPVAVISDVIDRSYPTMFGDNCTKYSPPEFS